MWDHRNNVRLKTTTPAKQRRILALNLLVQNEYERGTEGLRVKDHHWLLKPEATIIQYDYHRKEQWAESIQLARVRFDNQEEHKADMNRRQRELFTDWLTVATGGLASANQRQMPTPPAPPSRPESTSNAALRNEELEEDEELEEEE